MVTFLKMTHVPNLLNARYKILFGPHCLKFRNKCVYFAFSLYTLYVPRQYIFFMMFSSVHSHILIFGQIYRYIKFINLSIRFN